MSKPRPFSLACALMTGFVACGGDAPDAANDEAGETSRGTDDALTTTSESTSTDAATDGTGEPADSGSSSDSDAGTDDGGSSDGGTTGGESGLAAVELCRPDAEPIWQTEIGGDGLSSFVAYACTEPCRGIDECSVPSGGFSEVYFVVDQMGGAMRWQLGTDLVFMHNGGTGTSYPQGALVDEVLVRGHGVAMARWETGSSVNGREMGWVTRPDADATDFVRLTARVASLIAWVDDNLVTGRLGTAACSAGAYVTFAAQAWHGIGERLSYQLFVGGPPFASLARACGTDGGAAGRCSVDPTMECDTNPDCGAGICSGYLNTPEAPLVEMVDSAHLSGSDCEQAIANAAWDASDLLGPGSDFELSHPVDFVMNMGPGPGDPLIGSYAHAWDVSQMLTGADVGWYEQPGAHCQAFTNTSAWPLLEAGMGW